MTLMEEARDNFHENLVSLPEADEGINYNDLDKEEENAVAEQPAEEEEKKPKKRVAMFKFTSELLID